MNIILNMSEFGKPKKNEVVEQGINKSTNE